ncbi:hypothetical protein GH714_015558 [Hevea brasiliensis]|uniref:NAD-dependent epimerase/dehydratase domain-containing protein n=1 Tax=Hevea brasiliensis TaxID=3981 RepID=A0A6A6NHH8_HEVBR|nr:hypothetical protein GH714_015558 [Hevea brasiliensis]
MDFTTKLSKDKGTPLFDIASYRRLVGKLLYLTTTRHDLSFATHQLSQFLSAPTDLHEKALHRVLRYIKASPGQVDGVLNIMRSCLKAKTIRRFIYTSTAGTVAIQPPPPLPEYDESFWTDVDFCYAEKMPGWSYLVAKTKAEKAAWEFAKENGINLVTVHLSLVVGPFLTFKAFQYRLRIGFDHNIIGNIVGNEALYKMIATGQAVHLEDACSAHIFLFEHPEANGRYICSNHSFTIVDLAKALSQKYPEYNVPTKFESIDESLKAISCSSKKLLDLGFTFKFESTKYDVGDLYAEAFEFCREKGIMPQP